jgi:site-specific recombinase XerD
MSLFADSGLRLSELANIKVTDMDRDNRLIRVWCKGNKEGPAPFGERTEYLLKDWLSQHNADNRLWDLNTWGIVDMLQQLRTTTGLLHCNPHIFRRTFASILAKNGVDSLHIKKLGGW